MTGFMPDALTALETALTAAETEAARLMALLNLLRLLRSHDGDRTLLLAREAQALAESLGDAASLADIWISIGIVHRRTSDYAASLAAAAEAYRLLTTLDDSESLGTPQSGQAEALSVMAHAQAGLGNYADALSIQLQNLALRRRLNDTAGEAGSLYSIGSIYYALTDYPNALDFFQQGLSLYQTLSRPAPDAASAGFPHPDSLTEEANVLLGIGSVYERLGDYASAAAYQRNALAGFEAAGHSSGAARALNNLANAYCGLSDYPAALEAYHRSLQFCLDSGDRYSTATLYNNLGITYIDFGDEVSARSYFDRSLELSASLGYRHLEAMTRLQLGKLFTRRQRYADALDSLHAGLLLASDTGAKEILYELHEALASVYDLANEPHEALRHFRLYHDIEREVFSSENRIKLSRLQVLHQVEAAKRETEIHQLRNVELAAANQALQFALLDAEHHRELAESANRFKSELLSIAAHDLKNPLQVILGYAELLNEQPETTAEKPAATPPFNTAKPNAGKPNTGQPDAGDADTSHAGKAHSRYAAGAVALNARDVSTFILHSSRQMLKLINDLLQTVAAESGKLKLALQSTDLSLLLETVVAHNRHQAERKSQPISTSIEPRLIACVDADRFRDVFENLLSNAIKYTPKGKKITVSFKCLAGSPADSSGSPLTAKRLQLRVEDEGQGLSEEDLQNLFGKFQRLSALPTGNESATGLGLFIVKQLVGLHGGTVRAESKGVGKGCTFVVEIPVEPPLTVIG